MLDDADEDAETRIYGAFGDKLCEFDEEAKRCLDGTLEFEPDAATIVDWTYYYGKDLGTEDGKLAFVEDVDDDEPDFSDAYDIPMAHFNGTLRSFVLLREDEDTEEDVDEDSTLIGVGDDGEYLVGVSDDGKVVVIKLDDGEPEEYAVLHASYDGEGPVTSMVYDGDAVYFTSDNGLYKIDLPIIVAEWCWDGEDVVCYLSLIHI